MQDVLHMGIPTLGSISKAAYCNGALGDLLMHCCRGCQHNPQSLIEVHAVLVHAGLGGGAQF